MVGVATGGGGGWLVGGTTVAEGAGGCVGIGVAKAMVGNGVAVAPRLAGTVGAGEMVGTAVAGALVAGATAWGAGDPNEIVGKGVGEPLTAGLLVGTAVMVGKIAV